MTMISDDDTDTPASHDAASGEPVNGGPERMRPPRARRRRMVAGAGFLTAVILAAGAIGVTRSRTNGDDVSTSATSPVIEAESVAVLPNPSPDTLDELIESLRLRLEAVPSDHTAWATLGLAYVQQAKAAVDPTFYQLADGALAESLALDTDENFLAHAGQSALSSARHDFELARTQALRGLEINDFSAILHGALSDAELQLGNYDAAFAAIDRMIELSPDTTSFARASYAAELQGDLELARLWMVDALEAAPSASDRAFALFHLGELAFNAGRPDDALDLYNEARREVPDDAAALFGKARAEAALGQVATSLDHYEQLVEQAPEPGYVAAYATLLESLGRTAEAQDQRAVVDAMQVLFADSGVRLDAGPILYQVDHGDPVAALDAAEVGVSDHPFVTMYDAYAWALHANGRHAEALEAADEAAATGYRSALQMFHRGMIKEALGDTEGAIDDLSAALATNPHFDPMHAQTAESVLADLTAGEG